MTDVCRLCTALAAATPEDVLCDDGVFTATTTMDVPGWVLVSTVRHAAQGLWSLDERESALLGPLLRDVSRALRAVTGAERTYLMSLGEHSLHFHAMVLGRTADDAQKVRGAGLLATAPERADRDRARAVAADLRKELAAAQAP